MMTSFGWSSSSLGAQKQNKKIWRWTPTHYHLFSMHKNKTKKDDDERWLVVFFFQCTETKQKKLVFVIVTTNEKRGDLGEKCTCILANMISLVL